MTGYGPVSYEERIGFLLRDLYSSFGYAPFKVCRFEPYDFYSANKNFITGEHILAFTDINGKLMALKPDVTLSIIKNYSSGLKKVYYHENVYRESRNAGEFGEIPQTGIECIGAVDRMQQAEVISMAMKSLGIISERWILNIASMKMVGGLLEETRCAAEKGAALLSCLRRKNRHETAELTAGEAQSVADAWETLASFYGPTDEIGRLEEICLNDTMREACAEIKETAGCFSDGELSRVRVDFSIISDTAYYNGPVFKGYIDGVPAAVLSGGRYDHLAQHLGKKAQAIGFAVYLDMLGALTGDQKTPDADVLLLYGKDTPVSGVLEKAGKLRAQGRSVLCMPEALRSEGTFGEIIKL